MLRSQMKTKKRRHFGEEFDDPERKDNLCGRNKTRLELWEEHLKDPIVALDKALKCVEKTLLSVFFGPRPVEGAFSNCWCVGFLQSLLEKTIWEGVWPYLNPWDRECFVHAQHP